MLMNNERRKTLSNIIENLEVISSVLEEVYESETEAFDNLPESIQESERGQVMEENAYELDDVRDLVDEVAAMIQNIIDK